MNELIIMHTWTQHVTTKTFPAYLHGGDDGGYVCAVSLVHGVLRSKHGKDFRIVRLIAIDLRVGTSARRRAVQHSTQVVLEHAQEKQNPPPINSRRKEM